MFLGKWAGRNPEKNPENTDKISIFYCLAGKNREEIRVGWGEEIRILAKIFDVGGKLARTSYGVAANIVVATVAAVAATTT